MGWTWQWPAALILWVMIAPVVAQPSGADTGTVLHELRLLRQAIETLARANAVAHVSVGRLHIQEQRMMAASARLNDVTERLSMVIDGAAESTARIAALEEDTTVLDAVQQADRRRTVEYLKQELTQFEVRRLRLTAEQRDAAHALAIEQGNWVAINQRLDDVERTLTPKPN